MDRVGSSGKPKVRSQYVRFFETLGVTDAGKLQVLSRHLQLVHDVASQLDSHLEAVGASLHVAVSRMCKSVNQLGPSQHRWIRVVDRLGFFNDTDVHASRIVNIGLSYAYRHKELDAIAATNTLLLADLRLAADPGEREAGRCPPLEVPREDTAAARPPESSGTPLSAGAAALPPSLGGPSGAGEGDLQVPVGGLVVPRPGDVQPAATAVARTVAAAAGGIGQGGGGDDLQVREGGILVETRETPFAHPAAAADQALSAAHVPLTLSAGAVGERGGDGTRRELPRSDMSPWSAPVVVPADVGQDMVYPKVVSDSQPVVKPTEVAVKSVVGVLEGMLVRGDVRQVLQQLVCDSLLCWARQRSGAVRSPTQEVVPANVEQLWTSVRKLLHRWWPTWEASPTFAGEAASVPPPGTVSFITHPHRRPKYCKWAIDVDVSAAHDIISRLQGVGSARYFDKEKLPSMVTVMRVGPSAKSPILMSVATLLLVASKEYAFPTLLTELASMGRAPEPKDKSVVVATCHEFETAGLEAPAVLLAGASEQAAPFDVAQRRGEGARGEEAGATGDGGEPDALSDGDLASAGVDDAGPTLTMEERYKQMEELLDAEKAAEAVANRSHRVAVRRLTRSSCEADLGTREAAPPPPPDEAPSDPPASTLLLDERPGAVLKKQRVNTGGPSGRSTQVLLKLGHLCPPRGPAAVRIAPAVTPTKTSRVGGRAAPGGGKANGVSGGSSFSTLPAALGAQCASSASADKSLPIASVALCGSAAHAADLLTGVAPAASKDPGCVRAVTTHESSDGAMPSTLVGNTSSLGDPPDWSALNGDSSPAPSVRQTPRPFTFPFASGVDDAEPGLGPGTASDSSLSSSDQPINLRLRGAVAHDSDEAVGRTPPPGSSVAAFPFPSTQERELARQRVAAAVAASHQHIAAVIAMRNPPAESTRAMDCEPASLPTTQPEHLRSAGGADSQSLRSP